MQRARPFQFGLKALFGVTVYAAVVTWLVRGEPLLVQVFAAVYITTGCGQMLAAVALLRRSARRSTAEQDDLDVHIAYGLAYWNFCLTMLGWLVLVSSLAAGPLNLKPGDADALSWACFSFFCTWGPLL